MRAVLIAGAACIALTACGKSADNHNTIGNGAAANKVEDTAGTVVGAASASMANNSVDGYVTGAAIGDMYEIESSKIAVAKSKSPKIVAFAKQMIADHTATTEKLKATLASGHIAAKPPAALDSRRQGMIDNLNTTASADFDNVYLDQQTAAHGEALTLHQGYAEDGSNPALKKLAGEIAPKVKHHYEMVQSLDKGGGDGTH
jgi:putative membrane protein